MLNTFIIHEPSIIENTAIFTYSYHANTQSFSFREEVVFPQKIEFIKSIYVLAIACSISYFKLHLAPRIHTEWQLSNTEKDFWEWIFRNGFSELIYQNRLDWKIVDDIRITFSDKLPFLYTDAQENTMLENKAIVGIGGGKDSSVAVALLKKMEIPVLGFATKVRSIPLLQENTKALGVPLVEVVRKTDPQLLTLRENVYLGHIPISLVYAITGVVIAEYTKSKYVVVGNETSADESNTEWLDREVNHQWSKTSAFEKKVQDFVHSTIHRDITYFSILRPFGGLQITNLFTKICPHVIPFFSSCNKNFTVTEGGAKRWCGVCAKCVGTYVLLGTSLSLEQRISLFGEDIYQNTDLTILTKELFGLSPIKPFDCVATRSEMCLAATLDHSFKESPLGKTFSDAEWDTIKNDAEKARGSLTEYHQNYIPKEINERLRAIIQV